MEFLKNRLIESTKITAKGFKIISKASINKNDVCVAYLSCVRDPQEESIDLTIDVFFKSSSVLLEADIYRSDGSFIEDLGKAEIPFNLHNTISALDDYFDQLVEKDLKKYSDFILQQKDEPN